MQVTEDNNEKWQQERLFVRTRRVLEQLNLALCAASFCNYVPLNYNVQLHHKLQRHRWTIKVRFSLLSKLSDLRQSRVSGLTPDLPLPGFRVHFPLHHPNSNPSLQLYLQLSDQTQLKGAKEAQRNKCLKISPPLSEHRLCLPGASLSEGRLPRSDGWIWKWTHLTSRSPPELGPEFEGQCLAHAERMPEISQLVEDVQTGNTGLCDTRYLL